MQQTHDDRLLADNEQPQQHSPSTGPVAKARPGEAVPMALMGPAQKGREPRPIILPRISMGGAVDPHAPVLPTAAMAATTPPAVEYQATLMLASMTSEGNKEETHERQSEEEKGGEVAKEPIAPPPPPAEPGQEHSYPVITNPIPTPDDLYRTTPFPSSSIVPAARWSPRRQMFFLAGLGSGLFLYLCALVLVAVLVAPRVSLAATVTITPEAKAISTTLTVTALPTGALDPAHKQVTARLLSASSPTQNQAVPTTGTGHAPARAGEGTLTFYNAAPYAQTITAGTVLTGANGVEVVTEAPAAIPAGNPPTFGIITVPAHANEIGPQGNIAPLDLNGLCCAAGVSVKNTAAFHGGQYAYDYPMVTQEDIDQVAGPLLAALTPETRSSLQGEIHPNERLAGSVQCRPAVIPDHPVGSNASQVRVSVSVTCHGQVYDHQAVERLVTNALMQQAATTLGTGYSLHGTISANLTQAGVPPHAKPGALTLLVSGQGIWVYQVSAVEQARLTRLIAGLSRQQAIQLLRQQEQDHLTGILIQITGLWTDGARLPADPVRIHLLVAA